jgi:iron(III) transport system permease protein
MVTFALPASVVAVGVQLAYGKWLAGTLVIILIAYVAKLWALAYRPVAGAVDRLARDDIRAARASGAGPWATARTVLLPPLLPALAGAWLLVFLFALHELTMSSLLYGPGSETLAVVVLNLQELGSVGATSALAVLLTLVLAVAATPVLAIRYGWGRRRVAAPVVEPARA